MNQENWQRIAQTVGVAGDILTKTLPFSPRHPHGRNGYAHIWVCLRNRFGEVKELDDSMLPEVLNFIQYLVDNPK